MNDLPMFHRPDGRPLPAWHHLDTHRGAYRVRVTVDRGAKFTGQRICIPLRTRDHQQALALRDVAIEALARAGLLCRDVLLTTHPLPLEADAKTSPCEPGPPPP